LAPLGERLHAWRAFSPDRATAVEESRKLPTNSDLSWFANYRNFLV
jgi:hypothetical protein